MPRPHKEPSKVIAIPVTHIEAVSKLLNRPVANNQTPIVKIRVPVSRIEQVRKCILDTATGHQ